MMCEPNKSFPRLCNTIHPSAGRSVNLLDHRDALRLVGVRLAGERVGVDSHAQAHERLVNALYVLGVRVHASWRSVVVEWWCECVKWWSGEVV